MNGDGEETMRIRMLRNFDWNVPGTGSRQTVAYKGGKTYVVRKVAGDEAIRIGAAELIPNPTIENRPTRNARTRRPAP